LFDLFLICNIGTTANLDESNALQASNLYSSALVRPVTLICIANDQAVAMRLEEGFLYKDVSGALHRF
jgi:hypothetical protein